MRHTLGPLRFSTRGISAVLLAGRINGDASGIYLVDRINIVADRI